MTQLPSDHAEFRGSPGGPPSTKGTSPLRLILLLMVFGVALIGLLYDYTIARPGIAKAKDTVEAMLNQDPNTDPNNDNTITPDEVQQVLGRKPSSVEQRSNCLVEVYSWRSGLPTRTYDLKVVYTGRKFPLLYSAAANDEPDYPPITALRDEPTEEEKKNFKPPRVAGASASPGGGGKQRPGQAPPDGQGKRGPKPPADQPATEQPPQEAASQDAAPADPSNMNPPADPAPADPAPADPAPADPAKDSGGSTP